MGLATPSVAASSTKTAAEPCADNAADNTPVFCLRDTEGGEMAALYLEASSAYGLTLRRSQSVSGQRKTFGRCDNLQTASMRN